MQFLHAVPPEPVGEQFQHFSQVALWISDMFADFAVASRGWAWVLVVAEATNNVAPIASTAAEAAMVRNFNMLGPFALHECTICTRRNGKRVVGGGARLVVVEMGSKCCTAVDGVA
jgi:hypothetical protein